MGESATQSAPAPAGDEAQQAGKILVVDEDRNSREGLRQWLIGEGHRVETAADSWQAIRKVKESRFDIAVIDLDLPAVRGVALNGWDLVKIIRAYTPTIALIMLGSESRTLVSAELEAFKISEFIEKPVSLSHLKVCVRRLDSAHR